MMIITYAEHAVRVHIYKGLAFYYTSIHIPISTYHLYCLVFQSHPHLYSDESRPLHGGGGGGGAVIHTYIHVHTYMFYLSAHQDPEIRWGGGGDLKKKNFLALQASVWSKIKGLPQASPLDPPQL